jgi:dTDP-4-amino-4,6-dideoxygalactose transaminase
MEAIMALAKEHNLYVIEDNAIELIAVLFGPKKAGTIGHVVLPHFFHLNHLVMVVLFYK